ncbi:MAG: 3-oxoacyl-[acyl-carrier protein] reductase [uncultured Truepera sp.]|uniref:3-oxoacyl-[acyl-carrier protein] reductase n=1 Tax=uncultured Truepera sp. TaxID=543023 RepID=A0A6J4VVI1_9DEIN|nr:MAG: 3-oxoacyl-[acyl-carrier protein] reductase [uncultured Truepera sp.]
MDLAFNGRLTVVTGADSGIGLHTAMTLAAEGAKVLLSDLNSVSLADALNQVRQHAPEAEVYSFVTDLTDLGDVGGLLEAADAYGGVPSWPTWRVPGVRRGTFSSFRTKGGWRL